jgi:DNA-binding response OmpR family regulator
MAKKILIVDDDEAIVDAISLILDDLGYKTSYVSKGSEVYDKVESFKPDLILLDVLMSGKDGREICGNLKSNPETKNIPVVMVSAHPSAKKSATEIGADGFLAKPFQVEDLTKIIKAHIK